MAEPPNSSRRDFIKGRSALRALRDRAPSVIPNKGSDLPNNANRQNAYLEHFTKRAMACEFALMFNMQQYPQSGAVAASAFQLIEDLEDQLSIYRSHSEVSELNRVAVSRAVNVETKLFELFRIATRISSSTNGAFDITSGPLTKLWGFDRRDGSIPNQELIVNTLKSVGYDKIEYCDTEQTVRFLSDQLSINLGGIGKGHSLDRAAYMIEDRGIQDFIIHGGQSSVIARGRESTSGDDDEDAGWQVGLSHPMTPDRRLGVISLRNEALGTSGTGRQGFFVDGKRYGHIIDPRTGWPTDHFLSTTVITPSAALSDALATAFFVMALEEVEVYCRANPDVKAICVAQTKSGQSTMEWFNLAEEDWKRT